MEINEQKRFIIVVLANVDPPVAELTARNLRALFGDFDGE